MLWEQDGSVTDLGSLGGAVNNFAWGINNGVDVVGQSDLPGDATGHAFLWTKNHGMEDLGTLTGDFSSQALGINRDGEIVVESCDVNGNCRVALWQDVMTDLNSLAPPGSLYMVSPFAINDAGDVVGWGCIVSNGVCGSEQIPFLAVPCDNDGDGDERRDDGQATTAPSERTKVLLPDSLRRRPGRATGFFARLTTGFLKSDRLRSIGDAVLSTRNTEQLEDQSQPELQLPWCA